jgi:aminomethyltransferase
MSAAPASDQPLKRTPLYVLHVSLGAKMVPFAGYEMPVQYPLGILREHQHTRAQAGLFDVSHMGQAFVIGPDHATTAAALEALVPADILNLGPGKQRYSQLLADDGGIIDDLMVTRSISPGDDGRLFLVVNASRKQVDYAHISSRLPAAVMHRSARSSPCRGRPPSRRWRGSRRRQPASHS